MKNYGFIRTAAAVPIVKVADVNHNISEICRLAEEAFEMEVSLIVFPELSVTGATCGDLFMQSLLVSESEKGIRRILEFSRGKALTIIVGAPVPYRSRLYDCAVVIRNGNVKGIVPKTYVSAEDARWFASGADFLSEHVRNDSAFLSNGKDTVRDGYCGEIRYAGQRCNISPNMLFGIGDATFAIEIGDDLWAPVPPSSYHALQGATIIAGLAADRELVKRDEYRRSVLREQSSRLHCGYVYAPAGFGESTTDNVFEGSASIWEDGTVISQIKKRGLFDSGTMIDLEPKFIIGDIDVEKLENLRRGSSIFKSATPDGLQASSYYRLYNRISLGEACDIDFDRHFGRYVEPHPFCPIMESDSRCYEALKIQVKALATRLRHIGCRSAVVGISGGLDSTLALLVTVMAADELKWERSRIIGVTMPGFGTTSRTKDNAVKLMQSLEVTIRDISIVPACEQHFRDLGHDASVHDATYENTQARERTQILMDIANQTGGIVIGTGDLSELALGWCTYNGDHMSMYAVNAGVPKTLVRNLARYAGEEIFGSEELAPAFGCEAFDIILDIQDTPISPELLPVGSDDGIRQVTEDLVGPYELHDFFIFNLLRYGFSPEKIMFLAVKAFEDTPHDEKILKLYGYKGRYDRETIEKWLRTFFRRFLSQQFKRSCSPDGPAVGSVSLSPRTGLCIPSDAWGTMFEELI